VQPPGSLIFMGGTTDRRPRHGEGVISTVSVATQMQIANLALKLGPLRVNLVAAGFVDTRLSASLLGDQLETRRQELRAKLPIGRVVGPSDVAALAVHLMINTAITGATFDHRRRAAASRVTAAAHQGHHGREGPRRHRG
jgi:NAD(P)-dependent dehydrogenase (short-subunit alcohol dehydrogenase family)